MRTQHNGPPGAGGRRRLSVVIGAGGTGGHIYPGLALAEALRRAEPDAEVSFVGTERGLETRLIPQAGYRLHTVDMIPFDASLGLRRYALPAALLRSARACVRILREQGASAAVGMGGYPSAPVVLGAWMAGLPCVVHESNAVPGRANRFAARLTPHVALAFDRTRDHLPPGIRPETVGMPLTEQVTANVTGAARAALRAEARARLGVPDGARLVLVNGGSLGAARLTEAAVGLAARWRDRPDVRLLVKTGPAALPVTAARLAGHPGARAVAYLDRMDHAYAAADLVVCRAGSATVAELATVGLPAVLVPYPHAPHDHQTHNARVLTDAGAGLLLPDGECVAHRLAALVEPLLADPRRLAAMGRAAGPGDHARAADLLAAKVLRAAGHPTATPHNHPRSTA
ncbi:MULTISPECIES: UDP-N-acetylglucosamine--N-acetylmuramyl-(pentapeptide) pyrophosphoryl-undecaprenol N-acetylglucosamine transferase [Streptomycetaceae]|uniref:UDP-N-acetylglucosamine--N-acetylmuramyl-(pentapeptide) pyrophosphoryl-undecaprenol N-acetylglucosamine transferase n=1 Tax=Streptantibioticus cattleyicolor (strain ATCC 35852 / DSM 46488 / JCM 4925 / NBRC 14057 / NRRL 8057) TaxID=1003195 RepID=F8JNW5_STREN|nr:MULTISPECIES: UDP-N-acetylglucosamine--N-acetylmuramyl-(pentapeptide) pyrophosphoryl-undecaprenol N-acetylglucosamine transferase [Streptomycetaceae]AEW92700.1 N-acetylglucosaminyl transferase [Streptantibioticus cattleyicolor NRRL 8057 = DSM 46488]MYS57468.1 UDP-N-acetylglucosamine--N-acetylmuramyl-(pentapeptide) pyrophosphoryl-undecaprenol N-acetylglucosamine transferase [Streptomyces sp. SID5468]CCB73056.1 N-acetylglucosaminyl transferase [Streptantibioticus cattleyicolor NRRL 8057 = DSM 4